MRRTKWLLAAVAGFSLCAVRASRATVTYTTVAVTGQAAPGVGVEVKFAGVGDALMNTQGQVSFGAGLAGPGVDTTNSGSIWVGRPGDLHLVARTGVPAPDAGGAEIALIPFANLGISDAGEVAFGGVLSPLNSGDVGLWVGTAGSIHLQARTGSPAPGAPAGATFSELFSSPGLGPTARPPVYAAGDQLKVIFGARIQNQAHAGYWMATSAGTQLIVLDGMQAPDTPSGVTYSFFGPDISAPSISADGQLAIQCRLQGPGVTSANNTGLWAGPPGALQLVARAGDPAAGLGGQIQYGVFFPFPIVMGRGGRVGFIGTLAGSGVDATNNGAIWVGKPGALQLLVRTAEPAPGASAGVTWHGFDGLFPISAGGEMVFSAGVSGPSVDPNHNLGYWAGSPGSIHLLALPGAPAWGLPSDVHFGDVAYPSPSVNPLGTRITVAYAASLTGNGVNSSNDSGLWAGTGGNIKLIVREGDQAPGLPMGVTFDDLAGFGVHVSAPLNSLGEIAFGCSLAGLGVNAQNAGSIWVTDASGNPVLIARDGDLFDVGGGDFRTIKSLEFIKKYQQIYDEVGASPDEAGRVGFVAEFTDGSSGIFFATVPEPSTMFAFFVAVAASVSRRWRVRGLRGRGGE